MRPFIYRLLCILASFAIFGSSLFASPLNSKLLSLVPPGAEIVAGFENHPGGHKCGRLLLSTHNDRIDLDDWQALAGVDNKRVVDEVIEVAATSSIGRLTEHLLLVGGRFDKERIFSAAELNGAEKSEFEGLALIVIQPFAREENEMLDKRWLVILDDRIAMFGTESMVQRALRRYQSHATIDMALMERLSQMPSDVSSWNVLVAPKIEKSLSLTQPNSLLAQLIDGAEVLMVGTRFGSTVRVDFLLHARSDQATGLLNQKASAFADMFAKGRFQQSGPSPQRRGESLSVDADRVHGSVELSAKEFEEWNELGGFTRSLQGPVLHNPGHGE